MKKIFIINLLALFLVGMSNVSGQDTLRLGKYSFTGDKTLLQLIDPAQLISLETGDSCCVKFGEERKSFVGHWYWWKWKIERTDGYCYMGENYVISAKYVNRCEYDFLWLRMILFFIFSVFFCINAYFIGKDGFFSWVSLDEEKKTSSSLLISAISLSAVMVFLTPFSYEPSLLILKGIVVVMVLAYVGALCYFAFHPVGRRIRAYRWPQNADVVNLARSFFKRDFLVRTNRKDLNSNCWLITFTEEDLRILELLPNYLYDRESRVLTVSSDAKGIVVDKEYSFSEKCFL